MMKKRLIQGFTLMETVIYVSILSLFIMILTQTFTSILDTQLESQATSSVEQDGSFILSRFIYDLHRAQGIIIPALPGEESDTLQISIDGVNYAYSLNNGILSLTDDNGAERLNSAESIVSNLQFRRVGNLGGKNSVNVTFTVSSTVLLNNRRETKDYQTTIGLR